MEDEELTEDFGPVTSCGACGGYGCSWCVDWFEYDE